MRYPGPGGQEDYVALGQLVYGLESHFVYGQSFPCLADDGECEGCDHGQIPRWYGYLPALWIPSRRKVLVCISEGAYRECKPFQELDGKLRGTHFRLQRMKGGKSAPVRLTVLGKVQPGSLPATFDVIATLTVLWRLNERPPGLRRVALPAGDGPPHLPDCPPAVDAELPPGG